MPSRPSHSRALAGAGHLLYRALCLGALTWALGTTASAQTVQAPFFDRLPDPGDRFLGTHPRNSQRKETVARVVAQMRR